jgi:hypothetical protein
MAKARVLVTGLSGLIGRALRNQIEGRVELSALNRRAVDGIPCHRADIADLEAIAPAFEGVDTVVHLAADATSPNPPWPSILNNNVTGTYNVYEAARRAKVKRVVFASSGVTVAGIESDPPYRDLVAGRYDGLTSWPMVTHLSGEAGRPLRRQQCGARVLGRQYADVHGLSVICVRIGRVHAQTGLCPRASSPSGAVSVTSCGSSSAASTPPPPCTMNRLRQLPEQMGAIATSSTRARCSAGSPWTPPKITADSLPALSQGDIDGHPDPLPLHRFHGRGARPGNALQRGLRHRACPCSSRCPA